MSDAHVVGVLIKRLAYAGAQITIRPDGSVSILAPAYPEGYSTGTGDLADHLASCLAAIEGAERSIPPEPGSAA